MEKRRITRREILCLLILLALAAALYLHGLQRPTGGTAVIEQDGKTLHRIAHARPGGSLTGLHLGRLFGKQRLRALHLQAEF